jgi:hypothetical protein
MTPYLALARSAPAPAPPLRDATNPTIHGLRGTGILLRYSLGYEVDQIANDIGMSRPMVERYMRFKDQMEIAAGGATRPRLLDIN